MIPPDELADLTHYQGDVLMAKALRWYTETLGNRLKTYFELRCVPARLAQTVWRVRIAGWYGSVEFFLDRNFLNKGPSKGSQSNLPSMNIFTLFEDLPQGQVDRLTDGKLEANFMFQRPLLANFDLVVTVSYMALPTFQSPQLSKADFDLFSFR